MSREDDLPEFARIRLFVEHELSAGARILLGKEQSHYLHHVMRRNAGDSVRVFNGKDGEWSAHLSHAGRLVELEVEARLRPQSSTSDVTLAFAPIKKSPMEYLIEKATELGVLRLQPVFTELTQVGRVNLERLRAQAIEAAEQSWRLSVPEILEPMKLDEFLDAWAPRPLLYCDERGAAAGRGKPTLEALQTARDKSGHWAILIGPEGGFSPSEQARLDALPNALAVSLGPRIVRAETAAVMALTLWQATLGDLKQGSD
jgi:16S rRNA (uracil1498-N3)-methyltransferase